MKDQFVDKFEVKGTFVGKRAQYCHEYVNRASRFILMREPENKFDDNAIMVKLSVKNGQHTPELGYVPKDIAADIAPMIDSGIEFKATFRHKVINEKNGNFIGLWLNLIRVN